MTLPFIAALISQSLLIGARTTVTSFHHQPEAQHPKIFQLSTSRRPITPSLPPKADINWRYPRRHWRIFCAAEDCWHVPACGGLRLG